MIYCLNLFPYPKSIVRVRSAVFHGGEMLGDSFITTTETSGSHPEWSEWFESKITVSNYT